MKGTIYLNQKNIEVIRELRRKFGNRMAQTNSRFNGSFAVIRLYNNENDRGHPEKAIKTAENSAELMEMLND